MDRKQLAPPVIAALALTGLLLIMVQGDDYRTVEQLPDNTSSIEGEKISLTGKAVQGNIMCTRRACPENNSCCNTCEGSLNLEMSESIVLQGEGIGCEGNNCEIECEPEAGERYEFKGVFKQIYGQKTLQVDSYRRIENE